jgi:hypothetical protein
MIPPLITSRRVVDQSVALIHTHCDHAGSQLRRLFVDLALAPMRRAQSVPVDQTAQNVTEIAALKPLVGRQERTGDTLRD